MTKTYDLEEQIFKFAMDCRTVIKSLKTNISNIETNEKLGGKDLSYRLTQIMH